MSSPRALRLNIEDNVVIAVDEIRAGDQPSNAPTAVARVPKGRLGLTQFIGEDDNRIDFHLRPPSFR